MNYPHRILVLDAETLGLLGKPYAYAYGWVSGLLQKDPSGVVTFKEDNAGHWWFNPVTDASRFVTIDMEWAEAYVLRHLSPHQEISSHLMFLQLRTLLNSEKIQGATVWAECGTPCEAKLVSEVAQTRHDSVLPYPLHEIATVRLLAGIDPTGTDPRLPNEEPKHHPEKDARQSARLLAEALTVLSQREAKAVGAV